MQNQTLILPTARSIRAKIANESGFLKRTITIGEFLQKALLLEDAMLIDDSMREILLYEASNFDDFTKLQIDRNFLTFTKNSSFLLSFFDELSSEQVSIQKLKEYDFYAEYEEHLTILEQLLERYLQKCKEYGVVDPIFLKQNYKLNYGYIHSLGAIEVEIEGIASNFEMELFFKVAEITNLKVRLYATEFYTKMQQRFLKYGFELESGYEYLLDLSKKQVIEKKSFTDTNEVKVSSFSKRVEQVAFVKAKVAEFIAKGYSPDRIAVILPDEDFRSYLELFDHKHNFNFAAGKSFIKSSFYQKLSITIKALELLSKEHEAALQRVGDELYFELYGSFKKRVGEVDLEALFEKIVLYANQKELQLLQKEVLKLLKEAKYMQNISLHALLKRFVANIAKLAFDDVGGGKITIMGLLESRGISFDATIVVDFNEGVVPKQLDKDLFLNSFIKEQAGMPTKHDREELQKHYYKLLFIRSKEVAISYVKQDRIKPSRFLYEFTYTKEFFPKKQLHALLFSQSSPKEWHNSVQTVPFSFQGKRVSHAMLSCYLECKQKFYFQYIQKLQDFKIPKDIPDEWEIGKTIHEVLHRVYKQKRSYHSFDELYRAIEKEFDEIEISTELQRAQLSLYKEYLKRFCYHEIERFRAGIEVEAVEVEVAKKFGGLELFGRIDRIDRKDAGFELLDYKTGSIPIASSSNMERVKNFQLEFYSLLVDEAVSAGFYDIKEGRVIYDEHFEAKKQKLLEYLEELQRVDAIEIEMCEDRNICKWCAYKILCKRD